MTQALYETGKPQQIVSWQKPELTHDNVSSITIAFQGGINPKTLMFCALLSYATIAMTQPVSNGVSSVISSTSLARIQERHETWSPVDIFDDHPLEPQQDLTQADLVSQTVTRLRDDFDFPDGFIAELFSVTRQTVYNWRNQKSFPDHSQRVTELFSVLDSYETSVRPYLRRVLSYPTLDNRMLSDVLTVEGWKEENLAGIRQICDELVARAGVLQAEDARLMAIIERRAVPNEEAHHNVDRAKGAF